MFDLLLVLLSVRLLQRYHGAKILPRPNTCSNNINDIVCLILLWVKIQIGGFVINAIKNFNYFEVKIK